jgi:hypothetical protein
MEYQIKTCFSLYLNYMKNKIKMPLNYNVDEMIISDIRSNLDVIYMHFIMSPNLFNFENNNPGIMGYDHLVKMIDNFERKIKEIDIDDIIINNIKPKGWFY